MLLFCLMILVPGEGDDGIPATIRDLIYEAEVYERADESLETLRTMLCETTEIDRAVVRAMAIVKYQRQRDRETASGRTVLQALRKPNAVIFFQNQAYVLAESVWLELGDWVDDYFLLEVNPNSLLLETRDGHRREIRLQQQLLPPQGGDDYCLLTDCEAVHLLPFLAEKANLNWFKPSQLDRKLNGIYSLPDWLTLLDRVCERGKINYTRLGESVVFRLDNGGETGGIGVVALVDESLASFLSDLTERLDLELFLDEELAGRMVTFHAEDQSWQDTMQCLAIAHDFTWSLVATGDNERSKLIVIGN